jgi:hypothetical protein
MYPGSATDIATDDSTVGGLSSGTGAWWVGTNPTIGGYGIYHGYWTELHPFWNHFPVPGGAVRIATDPLGNPWVINAAHQIYNSPSDDGVWVRYPGAAVDIGVGNGAVWVVGTNPTSGGYGIYRWNGNGWTAFSGGAVGIAVGNDGLPWVINSAHQIYASD